MDSFTTPLLTGTRPARSSSRRARPRPHVRPDGRHQHGPRGVPDGRRLLAYLTQQVVTNTGLSVLLAIPFAFLVAGLLGLALEAGMIRWMYHRPLDTLLATVGVSLVLQQAGQGRLRRPG